ncbi:MAG TPA: pyruvate formate lyase family protein, partial [Spirochaetia bacterium]|nr:pyruvate formate lyase family protein [Spirochaetia bacterium]
MTERVSRLRSESFLAVPSISEERAVLMTEFYREQLGKLSIPMLRARSFLHLCEHKSIWIGESELIVGERGPAPKAVPTYPELNCHSRLDLEILRDRDSVPYTVSDEAIEAYERVVIPYWSGRSMRDRLFAELPDEWIAAYESGLFTEFMEQRAPGHTSLDGKIYEKGLREIQDEIDARLERTDPAADPRALAQREQLAAMAVACEAAIVFAERHAALAEERAAQTTDSARRAELESIASICRRVPAHAPRTFHEALQMYWFVHLGTITELNGWDAMNPGRLDQHLYRFYRAEVDA